MPLPKSPPPPTTHYSIDFIGSSPVFGLPGHFLVAFNSIKTPVGPEILDALKEITCRPGLEIVIGPNAVAGGTKQLVELMQDMLVVPTVRVPVLSARNRPEIMTGASSAHLGILIVVVYV
jgi:hypothetical protein